MEWIENSTGVASSDSSNNEDQKRPQENTTEEEIAEVDSVEDVKNILRNIIVGGELGLQCNTWEEFAKPSLTDRKTSKRFRLRRSKRKFKSRPSFEDFEDAARDLEADLEHSAREQGEPGKFSSVHIDPGYFCFSPIKFYFLKNIEQAEMWV